MNDHMNYGEAYDYAFAARPEVAPPIPLDALAMAGLRKLADEQAWDKQAAHVSDLSGLCDRETWARRKGLALEMDPDAALVAMQLGHKAEALLLDALEAEPSMKHGHVSIERQAEVRITLDGAGRLALASIDTPADRVLVGHIDLLARHLSAPLFVADVKSTVWWNRNERGVGQVWYPKDEGGKHGHRIQVATYALAVGAPVAGLYELDLGGKARRTIWFDPEPFRPLIERRMAHVLNFTNPANEEPEGRLPNDWTFLQAQRNDAGHIIGGDSWACGYVDRNGNIKKGYCKYSACDRHVLNTRIDL